jgi:hypothetical protein
LAPYYYNSTDMVCGCKPTCDIFQVSIWATWDWNFEPATWTCNDVADLLSSAFIALDITDGGRRREVNNDIDGVSGRGGEPDTAMAGPPGRVVVARNTDGASLSHSVVPAPPPMASAQKAVPVICYLGSSSSGAVAPFLTAFRQGLSEWATKTRMPGGPVGSPGSSNQSSMNNERSIRPISRKASASPFVVRGSALSSLLDGDGFELSVRAPAASARAAAVISESIGIPPHLSLPAFDTRR